MATHPGTKWTSTTIPGSVKDRGIPAIKLGRCVSQAHFQTHHCCSLALRFFYKLLFFFFLIILTLALDCPENSVCMPYGPGFVQCSCAHNFHGYKCLREVRMNFVQQSIWTDNSKAVKISPRPFIRLEENVELY